MAPRVTRYLWAGLVVVAAVACSSSDGEESDAATSSSPAAAATTTTTTTTTTSSVPDEGEFIVEYDPAALSNRAKQGRKIASETNTIERLADSLGATFKLPQDVPIVGQECGQFNAFWYRAENKIVLCYEMFAVAEDYANMQAEGSPTYFNLYYQGVTEMIAFHESGHMAVDLYSLPVTGREEDAADQLGALLLLTRSGPDGVGRVAASADFWFDIASEPENLDARSFADEHSLSQQRGYNLLCWDYGAMPDLLEVLIADPSNPDQKGRLPAERAYGCESEYEQTLSSWGTLLAPYLEIPLGIPDSTTPPTR